MVKVLLTPFSQNGDLKKILAQQGFALIIQIISSTFAFIKSDIN